MKDVKRISFPKVSLICFSPCLYELFIGTSAEATGLRDNQRKI
jgi:hypothetical protein